MTKPSNGAPPAEIPHPALPEHKLKWVHVEPGDDALFQCNGCKEPGAGDRYMSACRAGNLVLHKDCALAEPTLVHPLLKKSRFQLRREAPGPRDDARLCDACGGKVSGFYYHCANTELDLHPCCAKLPLVISQGDELTFELRKDSSHRCSRCRKMDGYYRFWFYRSTCKTVYLHVKCVKEMTCRSGAAGGSGSTHDDRVIPFVKEAALQSYRGEKAGSSKFERICKMVASVVHIIIAAIIGNPTPIVLAVTNAFISNVLQ